MSVKEEDGDPVQKEEKGSPRSEQAPPQRDDDDMEGIRLAVDEARRQFTEEETRRFREDAIAKRGMVFQARQALLKQSQQRLAEQALPEAKPKPISYAPKGIPTSMIISQPNLEEGEAP
jgi:hypothetical protein